jgi:tetratricopeptide (TPR) repeat protein
LIRKYDEAIVHFKKCLGLTPRNPQTLIAIGFVHALQGNYGQAIEYLHQVTILLFDLIANEFIFIRVYG